MSIVDPLDVTELTQETSYLFLKGEGFPVTRRMIKYAVMRRELVPVRLGNGNYFSRRDLLNWVESRRQPGIYHAPESRVAQ